MRDIEPTPPSSPSEIVRRLDSARNRGSWLSWAGFALALAWWGAAIGGVIALLGWTTISTAQPAIIVAATIALLLPGFMLLMAGFLAREQVRAGAANALVLEAAAKLLTPAEELGGEATAFAHQMSTASAEVDRSMGHALSAMRAMAGEIGDERQRLESVTYASADNARDLADRLSKERAALEQLTRDLREQTAMMGDAIPRQSKLIVDSAKAAAAEVAASESALESRLAHLDQTGHTLAHKIAAMDSLAIEAGKRNETLLFAIARMEEKLEQSRKTVETASRAGELAAAAAGTTGDRLMEAVRVALDGAREASAEIQTRTFETSEAAAKSLAELKEAGQAAAAAVRAAGMAARAELDMADRRATQTSQALYDRTRVASGPNAAPARDQRPVATAAPVPPPAAPPHPPSSRSDPAPEHSHVQASTHPSFAAPSSAAPMPASPVAAGNSQVSPAPRPMPAPTASLASPSRTIEEDLFEASADRIAQAMLRSAGMDAMGAKPSASSERPYSASSSPMLRDRLIIDDTDDVFDDDPDSSPVYIAEQASHIGHPGNGHGRNGNSLSDIIADMERQDRPTLSREETAGNLLDRLESSGIHLTDIFRPKDKKKIAFAARKGEKQRRASINQSAGRQVERVRSRLRGDQELMSIARDFVALEEADALNALENTHASNKNASARLATYLLLDAALG